MATFTITLKDALAIDPELLDAEYPIWKEEYRETLDRTIRDWFWNREIGQETLELFKLAYRRKMNLIMPLYNQHYVLSDIDLNPLETINIRNLSTSEGETTGEGNSTNESNSGAKSRVVASDFPQTRLAGDGDYASGAQDSVSDALAASTTTETNSGTQSGTVDSTTSGFQGHSAVLIAQYRQTLVNIDMMILEELESLFMLIWSNGDEFTERQGYGYGYYGFPF
jgi:hypothetical protein